MKPDHPDWLFFLDMLEMAREFSPAHRKAIADTGGAPNETPEAIAFAITWIDPPAPEEVAIERIRRNPLISPAARYVAIKNADARCCACGQGPQHGVYLEADHIKPVSLYPELKNDPDNLQILCRDCNIGKGNRDETDWRR